MTQQGIVQDAAEKSQNPKYFIDEAWYQAHKRSLQHMVDSRMEAMDGQKEKAAAEKPAPRRRGARAAAKSTPMESLAKVEGFIHPELTLLEAVFRLLLVHQNKPMDVEQISQELAEHGIGVTDTRVVNARSLARLLDGDFHYGIKRYAG